MFACIFLNVNYVYWVAQLSVIRNSVKFKIKFINSLQITVYIYFQDLKNKNT